MSATLLVKVNRRSSIVMRHAVLHQDMQFFASCFQPCAGFYVLILGDAFSTAADQCGSRPRLHSSMGQLAKQEAIVDDDMQDLLQQLSGCVLVSANNSAAATLSTATSGMITSDQTASTNEYIASLRKATESPIHVAIMTQVYWPVENGNKGNCSLHGVPLNCHFSAELAQVPPVLETVAWHKPHTMISVLKTHPLFRRLARLYLTMIRVPTWHVSLRLNGSMDHWSIDCILSLCSY